MRQKLLIGKGAFALNTTEVNELQGKKLRVKIRLDFKGVGRPGRFLFKGRSADRSAEEIREQQVALFRNVPVQGIHIDEIDMSTEVYTVYDDTSAVEVAYAPLMLTISADSLGDLISFVAREDFRKIEVIEPSQLNLTRYDIERLLFGLYEEIKNFRQKLERKYSSR